jgi:hypothetical protein
MATRERPDGIGVNVDVAVGAIVGVALGAVDGVAVAALVGVADGGAVGVPVGVDIDGADGVAVGVEVEPATGVSVGAGGGVSEGLPGRQPAASSPTAKALICWRNLRREMVPGGEAWIDSR